MERPESANPDGETGLRIKAKMVKRQMFANLLDSGEGTDVVFRIDYSAPGGEIKRSEIKCHRLILTMSSQLFGDLFYGPRARLLDTDVFGRVVVPLNTDPKVFNMFIRFMYMKTVRFDNANEMLDLYKLGETYQTPGLKQAIVELVTTNQLTEAANKFFAYSFLNDDQELRDVFQPLFNHNMAIGVGKYLSSTLDQAGRPNQLQYQGVTSLENEISSLRIASGTRSPSPFSVSSDNLLEPDRQQTAPFNYNSTPVRLNPTAPSYQSGYDHYLANWVNSVNANNLMRALGTDLDSREPWVPKSTPGFDSGCSSAASSNVFTDGQFSLQAPGPHSITVGNPVAASKTQPVSNQSAAVGAVTGFGYCQQQPATESHRLTADKPPRFQNVLKQVAVNGCGGSETIPGLVPKPRGDGGKAQPIPSLLAMPPKQEKRVGSVKAIAAGKVKGPVTARAEKSKSQTLNKFAALSAKSTDQKVRNATPELGGGGSDAGDEPSSGDEWCTVGAAKRPSKERNGGSVDRFREVKTANNSAFVYTINLTNKEAGFLIGPEGTRVNQIRNKSGCVSIFINNKKRGEETRLMEINGTKNQVNTAVKLIKQSLVEGGYLDD